MIQSLLQLLKGGQVQRVLAEVPRLKDPRDFGRILFHARRLEHPQIPQLARLAYEQWSLVGDNEPQQLNAMQHMLAQALIKNRQLNEAESILVSLAEENNDNRKLYLTTLLDAYGRLNAPVEKLDQLISSFTVEEMDAHIYCTLIFTFASRRMYERLNQLVEEIYAKNEGEMNEHVYAALIRAYAHQDHKKARKLLDEVAAKGLRWNQSMFIPLFDSAFARKDFDEAWNLFEIMQLRFIQPNADTVATFLHSANSGLNDAQMKTLERLSLKYCDLSEFESWHLVPRLPANIELNDRLTFEFVHYLRKYVDRPDLAIFVHELAARSNTVIRSDKQTDYLKELLAINISPEQLCEYIVRQLDNCRNAQHASSLLNIIAAQSNKDWDKNQLLPPEQFKNFLKSWTKNYVRFQNFGKSLDQKLLKCHAWPISLYKMAIRHYLALEQQGNAMAIVQHMETRVLRSLKELDGKDRKVLRDQLKDLMKFEETKHVIESMLETLNQ